MSVINTNGTGGGNWADTATWDGGVIPIAPVMAHVVYGDNLDQVPVGEICDSNQGVIQENHGTVNVNTSPVESWDHGHIVKNSGTIVVNNGKVSHNRPNTGVITTNNGRVVKNSNLITTNGAFGVVIENGSQGVGLVVYNYGEVQSQTSQGSVTWLMNSSASVQGTKVSEKFITGPVIPPQVEFEREIGVVCPYNDRPLDFGEHSGKP